MVPIEQIVGAEQLTARFGKWPSFHDAEIKQLVMDRSGPNIEVVIHMWLMTNQEDARGYYILEKHTLVQIRLERIASSELSGFNHQNVLLDLSIDPEIVNESPGFRLSFDSSYGLGGYVTCTGITIVSVTPCDSGGRV